MTFLLKTSPPRSCPFCPVGSSLALNCQLTRLPRRATGETLSSAVNTEWPVLKLAPFSTSLFTSPDLIFIWTKTFNLVWNHSLLFSPQCGTADAEIKTSHLWEPRAIKGSLFCFFKPGVGIMNLHNKMLCLILLGPVTKLKSAFLVHSTSFSPKPLKKKTAKCLDLWKDCLVIRWIEFHPDIQDNCIISLVRN